MNLILYKSTAQPNEVDKTGKISQLKNLFFQPTDTFSREYPYIILRYDVSIMSSNYAYISDLGRYYFVESIEVLTGNRMALRLNVDVLMSFKEQILSATATIIRNSQKPTFITDSSYPINPYRYYIETKGFPLQPIKVTNDCIVIGVRN